MSKLEHVQIARRGSLAVAQWRQQHPGERLDYSGANLGGHNLNSADLSETDFSGADLVGIRLHGANLQKANLRGAVSLMGQLNDANLDEADLSGATLRRADLRGARFIGANLTGANLINADLSGADLEGAILGGANLSEANLSGANLCRTDLNRADLSNADLSGAILTEANLGKAIFYKTALRGAVFKGTALFHTVFADCDLSEAVDLDQAIHHGPSALGLDTLFRSRGLIPEMFLRGAGAPEDTLSYQRTIPGSPSQYYTCFISCCTEDLTFAERLQAALAARGVRCWYFAADFQEGLWVGEDVDRGIRYYDKLVVVCSRNALATERVRDEIAHGIQKQDETGRWLFLPVAISDEPYNRRNRYVNSTRLWRHVILDFRAWEDPSAYDKALDRLVEELNRDQDASVGMAPAEEEEG